MRRNECVWKKCIRALGVMWTKAHKWAFRAKEQKQHEKEEGKDHNNGEKKNNSPESEDGIQQKRKWSEGWSKVLKENSSSAWKNSSYIENSITTKFSTQFQFLSTNIFLILYVRILRILFDYSPVKQQLFGNYITKWFSSEFKEGRGGRKGNVILTL